MRRSRSRPLIPRVVEAMERFSVRCPACERPIRLRQRREHYQGRTYHAECVRYVRR